LKKQAINSRALDKRLKILEKTRVLDGYGGSIMSYSEVAERWASVKDAGGNGQRSDEIGLTDFVDSYEMTFRYDPMLKIDPKKHLIEYNGRQFSIVSVKTQGFTQIKQIVIVKENTLTNG